MTEFEAWLASDNGLVVHAGVFIMLILGGMGFPIPEDIPLLLGGVAVATKIAPIGTMFLVCYAGVMIGDQTMFFVGYRYGQRLLSAGAKSRFFPAITEEKLAEIREGLRKRRLLYIFIGRHLFPIRSATFISAGALRVPFLEFLFADAVAALVSVTLMMSLGYWLGDWLTPERVEHFVDQAHFYVLALAGLGAAVYLVLRAMRGGDGAEQKPAGPLELTTESKTVETASGAEQPRSSLAAD